MSNKYLKQFAIILDDVKPKENKSFFRKLIDSVSEKLIKKNRPDVRKKIDELLFNVSFDYGDALSFGDDLDLTYIPRAKRKYTLSADTDKYFLMRDFDELLELLEEAIEVKPKKSNKYEIEITIETPKRKKLQVDVYGKITILERWVKIGYEMYRRRFNGFTGDEYIIVDGDTYYIRRDRYGREYLA